MAGFEGTKWAQRQMCYVLKDKSFSVGGVGDKVPAVSRSVHYGLFLAFEGIRFFCKRNQQGKVEIIFLSLEKNLERFRRGISFNLGHDQQAWVPSTGEIRDLFARFFADPVMRDFVTEMADLGAQGYLRPFTFDEDQSIGVTFPRNPSIRAVVCSYDRYLGEPFSGVVIPWLVRATGVNGTGCLKLAANYIISVKAVDAAKQISPEAASALFLDDRPYDPLEKRNITEWDSSCCLFALRDGPVVKIPESNLILPSVTIQGICAILREMDVKVEERDMTYGELIERSRKDEIVAVCSIGTAGILNRAERILLVDESRSAIGTQQADKSHELYEKLGEARTYYWDIYQEKVPAPSGLVLDRIEV
jgi:branched-subunit amino acid aminotransferase/4-amino-4-deoxychorismate lyase